MSLENNYERITSNQEWIDLVEKSSLNTQYLTPSQVSLLVLLSASYYKDEVKNAWFELVSPAIVKYDVVKHTIQNVIAVN